MVYEPELYMHGLDRRALAALNAFPMLIKLKEAYSAAFDERAAKIHFMSSAVRLGENQMPEVYQSLPLICEKLGIVEPELYYVKSKEMNAATAGSVNPYIFVTSKLVEKMPADMIPTVLAHECGHIACRHSLYHSLAAQLVSGVDASPLGNLPGVRRFLTPALVRALLFWDRCSELSADRAAALCDGAADKTVDVLLRVHGYGDNVNREEFLKQALDLKEFVEDSKANKLIEAMLVQGESHPRLATRAYECYTWSTSDQFLGILRGTYTLATRQKEAANQSEEQEILAAQVSVETVSKDGKPGSKKDRKPDTLTDGGPGSKSANKPDNKPVSKPDSEPTAGIDVKQQGASLEDELQRVNLELERYTSHAGKTDYAAAICCGLVCGAVDSMFVGEFRITEEGIGGAHEQVNRFIQQYAKSRGYEGERLKGAISFLEDGFKVPQDNVWKGAGIGVVPKNHHLADLAHHPTPLGLVSAILVRFLSIGTFVNKDGEWSFLPVAASGKEIMGNFMGIAIPAVLTGVLNWLVAIAEEKYEEEGGGEVPEALHRVAHLVASAPILVEVAKCADNWFGHLVSDMGGSKSSAGGGMGIPGVFVSLLHEVSGLPGLKDSGLPAFVNDLYQNQKWDLRHEVVLYEHIGKQAIPVALNEILVRAIYFVTRLAQGVMDHKGLKGINWGNVVPVGNRTVDRMMTVASMTFTVADTADAAVRSAIESGGNWVLFAGRFVTRFNYVGAGRAAIAVVKEISDERKEAQLIHEKMILTEAKTQHVMKILQEYKAALEERVSAYLAEDIEAFMEGFDLMKQGIATGSSDLVIKGNVVIQRVLGREPQFTDQAGFDELMDSDMPLKL